MKELHDGMTCREVERWLVSKGFRKGPGTKSSHRRYLRGGRHVTLPYKRGGDTVSPFVLRNIERQADV